MKKDIFAQLKEPSGDPRSSYFVQALHFMLEDARIRQRFERDIAAANREAPRTMVPRFEFIPRAAAGQERQSEISYYSTDRNLIVSYGERNAPPGKIRCELRVEEGVEAVRQLLANCKGELWFANKYHYPVEFDEEGTAVIYLPTSKDDPDWLKLILRLHL